MKYWPVAQFRGKSVIFGTIRFRKCRTEAGLTTLEWLLIVAAVAGLAALAVVLVQNVVDETAEEIAGNSARETAARVAASRIETDVAAEAIDKAELDSGTDYKIPSTVSGPINSDAKSKCNRLAITYSDIGVEATWTDIDPITTEANKESLSSQLATQRAAGKGVCAIS